MSNIIPILQKGKTNAHRHSGAQFALRYVHTTTFELIGALFVWLSAEFSPHLPRATERVTVCLTQVFI